MKWVIGIVALGLGFLIFKGKFLQFDGSNAAAVSSGTYTTGATSSWGSPAGAPVSTTFSMPGATVTTTPSIGPGGSNWVTQPTPPTSVKYATPLSSTPGGTPPISLTLKNATLTPAKQVSFAPSLTTLTNQIAKPVTTPGAAPAGAPPAYVAPSTGPAVESLKGRGHF